MVGKFAEKIGQVQVVMQVAVALKLIMAVPMGQVVGTLHAVG